MRRPSEIIFLSMIVLIVSCRQEPAPKTIAISTVVGPMADLSAWADTPRARLEAWTKAVTDSSSKDFIPVADRIAVFDNDGTLWPEQPVPNQAAFALDMLRALAPAHPEWKKNPVLSGAIEGDMALLRKAGINGLLELVSASHNNLTTDSFNVSVRNWIDSAKDRKFNRLYKDVIYLPMVQLLSYLRAHGFKTFIVSGGGADFMRVWSDEAYGIAPYQVIGSYGALKYEVVDGKPIITKLPGDIYVDDKAGKPVAIHRFIGKVPVLCGGNSDGDQAMMQYTTGSRYKSLCILLHHTDGDREFAYDTKTLSGHLETALVEAKEKNWMVVDMKRDFRKIFAFE
jgi:haloacid dehalogenase-like hydrolase